MKNLLKNPTKKIITFIFFVFCFSINNPSFAQFGKLLDKTKTKTNNNATTTTTTTQTNGAFKVGDIVEWTNKSNLMAFGIVRSVPNTTQINVYEDGNSTFLLNNIDVKMSIPSTGKYKIGEKVAVVGLDGYDIATVFDNSKNGYLVRDANINVNKLWHEKNLYKFDEEQFNTITKPVADLLQKFQFAENGKAGYLQFTGVEAKDALNKLATIRDVLQPQKLNLPLTPIYEWKKNPNYTLYLVQQARNLLYVDICTGDTTMTASELLKNNLENATTEAVSEKDEHGNYPTDFSKYFVSTKGYENFMAQWKEWAKNREDVLAVLGKPEKNDWNTLKAVYDKKNAEYMTKLAIYSKTYDLNIAGQNATYEAMARKTLQTQYPNLKIIKSWLTRNDFVVRKDSYNIPTVKFMFVHFLCTSPDYKTQIHTSVEIGAYYSNGKYGALYTLPASKEQYWGRIGDFILGK